MPIKLQKINTLTHTEVSVVQMEFMDPISAQQFSDWLREMTRLLAKQQPFAAIYRSEKDLTLPDDYRSHEAQWYKANKAQFFQYCHALVRIANDEAEQQRLNSPAMHKAWQVPYTVVLEEEQAISWLEQRLTDGV